jgi:hypothetical protein
MKGLYLDEIYLKKMEVSVANIDKYMENDSATSILSCEM